MRFRHREGESRIEPMPERSCRRFPLLALWKSYLFIQEMAVCEATHWIRRFGEQTIGITTLSVRLVRCYDCTRCQSRAA